MLLKWITCRTSDRAAFTAGQQVWRELRHVPGFLIQYGGWSTTDPGTAHIFGFWQDQASYQTFMHTAHDRIAARQSGTYDAVQIHLFDDRPDPGQGLNTVPEFLVLPTGERIAVEPSWTTRGEGSRVNVG